MFPEHKGRAGGPDGMFRSLSQRSRLIVVLQQPNCSQVGIFHSHSGVIAEAVDETCAALTDSATFSVPADGSISVTRYRAGLLDCTGHQGGGMDGTAE